jgi:hypothetical protein
MKLTTIGCLISLGFLIGCVREGCVDQMRPGEDISETKADLSCYGDAIHLYRRLTQQFPTNEARLTDNLSRIGIHTRAQIDYLNGWKPWHDIWGTKYKYYYSNDVAVLISAGPDKYFCTPDDIKLIVEWRGDNSPLSNHESYLNEERRERMGRKGQ